MFTSDQQILKLPDLLIANGIIDGTAQFFEETEISKSYFSKVKNQANYGRAYHFTPAQIEKICLLYGINFNWVFATSEDIFSTAKQTKSKQKV